MVGKGRKGATRPDTVGQKRVRNADGELRTLRTIKTDSKTFGSDLTYVFGKKVAKARRENNRLTGSTDVVPIKTKQKDVASRSVSKCVIKARQSAKKRRMDCGSAFGTSEENAA